MNGGAKNMNVQINVANGEKRARVKIEGFPCELVETLLARTFQLIQENIEVEENYNETHEALSQNVEPSKSSVQDIVSLLPESIREWYKQKEKEAEEQGVPSFYFTGIKIKNGIPHYKAFYICPNCGLSGRHYVPEDVKEVKCHNCEAPIDIFPARAQLFKTDQWGNFFRSVMPDKE